MSNYKEDESRLPLLKQGDERAWRQLYEEYRSPFRLFFMKYSPLGAEEITELFHESMVVLHRNVCSGKLVAPLQSALKTYLLGIGKRLHSKKVADAHVWSAEVPELPMVPEVEQRADQAANMELVRRLLDKIGEPCRHLLSLIFLRGFAMEAVQADMGLPSEGAVRKRKFDCLAKMRKLMDN